VKTWRGNGYPGITGVTKKLLDYWNDADARQHYHFFWCQLDAMETPIWLTEALDADKTGIHVEGDGGAFKLLCTKLCTGGGKTTVMAMLIAWHVCNKVTYPQDKRFSKNVFIVAPGHTVRRRLEVLHIGGSDNYYTRFNVVPVGLEEKLRQGKVVIDNWQALAWDTEETVAKKKGVDKRGAKRGILKGERIGEEREAERAREHILQLAVGAYDKYGNMDMVAELLQLSDEMRNEARRRIEGQDTTRNVDDDDDDDGQGSQGSVKRR
jgi:hypothetical protein